VLTQALFGADLMVSPSVIPPILNTPRQLEDFGEGGQDLTDLKAIKKRLAKMIVLNMGFKYSSSSLSIFFQNCRQLRAKKSESFQVARSLGPRSLAHSIRKGKEGVNKSITRNFQVR